MYMYLKYKFNLLLDVFLNLQSYKIIVVLVDKFGFKEPVSPLSKIYLSNF